MTPSKSTESELALFGDATILSRKQKQEARGHGDVWKLLQASIVFLAACLLLVLAGHCLKKHVFHPAHDHGWLGRHTRLPEGEVALGRMFPGDADPQDIHRFVQFMREHRVNYANESESQRRFAIFTENVRRMRGWQAGADDRVVFEVNRFSDLTDEELKSGLLPFSTFQREVQQAKESAIAWAEEEEEKGMQSKSAASNRPAFLDWRTKDKVARVKDQGQCGSCWAFSVTAVVESAVAIKRNQSIAELSEQQLVDCNSDNNGCTGGYRPYAFNYVQTKGLTTEQLYFYVGKVQQCRGITAQLTKIDGHRYMGTDEDRIADWVAEHGPVSIGLNVTRAMYHYSSGVFNPGPEACAHESIGSHAMAVVGYGEMNGETYWLLKNSWGSSYGDSGYLRMRRGVNACGIANAVFAAIVN